jgi:excisionase family DNA binding protein
MVKEYFRVEEAAEYLCVAVSTIWLYIKRGEIKPIKMSTRVTIFRKIDLDNLVISKMEESK